MPAHTRVEALTMKGRDPGTSIFVEAPNPRQEIAATALRLDVATASDRGLTRASNEDACGYSLRARLFVVCDGMGGAAAGEVASHAAVDALLAAFAGDVGLGETSPSLPSLSLVPLGARNAMAYQPFAQTPGGSPRALLESAIAAANDAVFSLSENDPHLYGMGTTLVALLFDGEAAWIAHVGDSRAYRVRDGLLQRLTDDHSLVDEQVRRGLMTAEQARHSPLRHVITRAIGSYGSVTPEIKEVEVQSGDLLLLCSDGLVREVDDNELAAILAHTAALEDACRQMIDTANANGGHDNITCLLVRVL